MSVKAIPERLKQAREFAGLSMGQACILIGMSRERLVDIEDGSIEIGKDIGKATLKVMAQDYVVTEAWLCGYDPVLSRRMEKALGRLSEDDANSIRTLLQSELDGS